MNYMRLIAFVSTLPASAKRYGTLIVLSFFAGSYQGANAQSLEIDVNVFGPNVNEESAQTQTLESCAQIDVSTNSVEDDLLNTCGIINSLDPDDPEDAVLLSELLERITPEEAYSVNDSIVYVSDFQTSYVQNRITTLRSTPTPVNNTFDGNNSPLSSLSSLKFISDGGGDGIFASRLGLFFNASVLDMDIEGEILQQDTDLTGSSLIFGADYRLNDEVFVGAGVGYIDNDTDFSNVGGETSLEGVNFTLYGTWSRDRLGYIDAIIDVGINSYDLRREIGSTIDDTTGELQQSNIFALGDTDSTSISLSGTLGKYFDINAWQLGTYVRGSFTGATIDAYTETPSAETEAGFSSVFSIGEQSVESAKFVVGADISKAISTTKAVILPVARLEIQNEFEEDKEDLSTLLALSEVGSTFEATDRETAFASLSLGASAIFKNGINAYALFESFLGNELVDRRNLTFGFRLER